MTYLDKDQVLAALKDKDLVVHEDDDGDDHRFDFVYLDSAVAAIAALPAIPLDDEFIRKLLDVAPCVGVETGFCHAHDQRVSDCEEYFEYQKNRVQNLFTKSGLALPVLETKKETS